MTEMRAAKNIAEEATKLKDKFVSLVAHDLKSPFSSILGFLTLIQNDKKNLLHPDHRKMITRAHEAGNRLLRMIERLLNISRLQTGQLVPQKKFFDGRWAASSVIESLGQLAREKNIELTNKIPRGTRLYADIDLFREVLQNLVSNAIKFCGKGDIITLYVPHGENTTIAVIDTGVGIIDGMLPDIFRHEEATSTTGTAGERGTGLGLPLSSDIMKAHGGTLSAASIKGEGTVFYAQLPYIIPEILLVDDDEGIHFLLKEIMRQNGIDIVAVENGEEAIKLLDKQTPHLILTDLEMPRMNGFEFLERARENPKASSIPIIVITEDSNIETRQKAFQLGANDFVTKPLVLADLIPRIRRFVG
jgi:CheY-like chemotaxis protein